MPATEDGYLPDMGDWALLKRLCCSHTYFSKSSFLSRHKRSVIRFSSSVSPSRKPYPITVPLVSSGDHEAKANFFVVANWWQGGWSTLNPPYSFRTSVSSPLK